MNDIQNIGYKLEWVDHLFEIYSDFGRRNDPQEWFYFLRRPELVDADERRAIAEEVMKYILKYEHISRDIVELLEETFHYTDEYEYFTDVYGVNSLDYYRQVLLGREELPPYRLFEDIHDGADYDGFLYAFNEFYTKKPNMSRRMSPAELTPHRLKLMWRHTGKSWTRSCLSV